MALCHQHIYVIHPWGRKGTHPEVELVTDGSTTGGAPAAADAWATAISAQGTLNAALVEDLLGDGAVHAWEAEVAVHAYVTLDVR